MNYKEQLNRLLSNSGLTNKEIVERCKEFGEEITPNYISVLKNQEDKIPSENLSLALAKACNANYEDVLLIQGYIDKAPQPILTYMQRLYNQAMGISDDVLELITKSLPKALANDAIEKYHKAKAEIDLATFICEMNRGMYDTDLKELIQNKEKPKEYKWALIPVESAESIRILNKDELDNMTK